MGAKMYISVAKCKIGNSSASFYKVKSNKAIACICNMR